MASEREEQSKYVTHISPDIEFKGDLKFEHELDIEGFFEGVIETKGNVNILHGAVVNGDIKANTVYIAGYLQGTLIDAKFVHLKPTAQVKADIQSKEIQIDRKAVFNGVLLM